MPVNSPSLAYQAMKERWALPLALMGGTAMMRAAGKTYLPQEPKESDEAYQVRLHRTILYNMYKRTIQSLKGQAFIKPVVVTNVPKELEGMEFNFDGTGRSITEVGADLFEDCLVFGLSHGIVDMPTAGEDIKTLHDFREAGIKPYFSRVSPVSLIGWQENYDRGYPVLSQMRMVETSIEESEIDPWDEVEVHRVRVYYPDRVEIYKSNIGQDKTETWELEDVIDYTLGFIPVVTAYAEKEAFMTAKPTLEDLAWVNLAHWQSQSDQRNILHIARVPFILASGFPEGELEGLEIGANRIISTTDKDAKMKFIEHTGSAILAGRNDLIDLERQAGTLGADLVMTKSVARQTATARVIDQSESLSVIQLSLRSIERMLEKAYEIAGQWLGVDASEVSVTIGEDLSSVDDPNPVTSLIALGEALGLTKGETLELGKQRNIIPAYFEINDVYGELNVGQTSQPAKPTDTDDDESDEDDKDEDE